ncbi:MAG: glycosyltransferase, partial [Fimbriimonadaceae bacterium]
ERILARESFRPYRIVERVVRYGTAAPGGDPDAQTESFLTQFPRLRDRRFLLCLGRVHPKKGHDLLIEAYARVYGADRDAPELVLAGPDQIGWQASLDALAARLGVADHVVWTGMVTGDAKVGAYRACEAFVLPSHQENFGIVVAEALACGRPVLLTDKVNIWREVTADRAGLVSRDTLEGVVDLLTRWRFLSEADRDAMGARALACFEARFEVHAAARSLVDTVGEFLTA